MSAGDTDSLLATAQRFSLKYSEFRAESTPLLATSSRNPTSAERVQELSQRVQAVDQDIADWLSSIPPELRPKALSFVHEDDDPINYDHVEAFPGPIDVYPDFVTASAWNIGRVSRLLLASLAIRLVAWRCAPADYWATTEYKSLKRICEDNIAEIIASVPYHFGWHLKRKGLNEPGVSAFACGEEGPGKALPALFLMWSLTCVKNHDITTDEQRAWAKGRLKFVADQVGLKYAHIVNEVCYPTSFNLKWQVSTNWIFPGQPPLPLHADIEGWADGGPRSVARQREIGGIEPTWRFLTFDARPVKQSSSTEYETSPRNTGSHLTRPYSPQSRCDVAVIVTGGTFPEDVTLFARPRRSSIWQGRYGHIHVSQNYQGKIPTNSPDEVCF